MRLHLVALPHTRVESAFCGCAYTAKVLKFCKMMGGHHEIFLYAPEGLPVEGATLIPCLTNAERTKTFGADDPARLPAWPTDAQTALFNAHVVAALQEHAHPRDLVLLSGGRTHLPIQQALPKFLYIEPGVGYEGIFTNFCAFESYAWMHYVYGMNKIGDGRWYDCVIPNYFDLADFPRLNTGGEYLAFLGRRIERKGLAVAADIAARRNLPLFVAGAGEMVVPGDHVHYIGPVDVAQRGKFLSKAKALIVATSYIEPFGGVAVEAMLCGTPVITTDWGAFTETVTDQGGARFRTLAEGVAAVEQVSRLDPIDVRLYAEQRFSLTAVAPLFDQWFGRLQTLWGKGWYT